jgi:hypothetical protein
MSKPNHEKEREAFLEAMAKQYDELRQWREKHPEASFDEIALYCVECRLGAGLVVEIGVKSGCVRWWRGVS